MKINELVQENDMSSFLKDLQKNNPKFKNLRIHGDPEHDELRRQDSEKRETDRAVAHQKSQDDQAQDHADLPHLEAEYAKMKKEYEALGGSDWQYADREQNLSAGERKARSMESGLHHLANRIRRAKKHGEQGVAEAVDIGKEWMSDTELDQYVPNRLQQQWRELLGYDMNGNPSAYWANLTGGYEPDVNDPQHRALMVKVANKWFTAKKIPNVKFFDVKDADDELEWLVQIGQQGVAEGDSGAKYKVKSIGRDAKGDYYISPSTGQKVYKKGVKVGDHENPKTGEHKGVEEGKPMGESATVGATSAANISTVDAPHLSPGKARGKKSYIGSPGKSGSKSPPQPKVNQPKNKDGTAKNGLDIKGASLFGGPPIKRR